MKNKVSLWLIFVILCGDVPCILFAQTNVKVAHRELIEERIDFSFVLNGNKTPLLALHYLYKAPYVLEMHYGTFDSSSFIRAKKGQSSVKDSNELSNIIGYYITNLQTKTVYAFDSDVTNPALIGRYPVSDSQYLIKEGYDFSGYTRDIYSQHDHFFPAGDTVINHQKVLVFADTTEDNAGAMGTIARKVAYLNTEVKNPIVQLMSVFDKKYGGWVYRVDYYGFRGERGSAATLHLKSEYKVTSLSPQEKKKIEKLISAVKSVEAGH